MEDDNAYSRAVGWFLIGGMAGACAALMWAPASGKRTRERLARRIRDTKETVSDLTDDLADTSREIVETAGRIGDRAARLAGDASAAARGVASALGVHTLRSAKR
jgi:gas vesicle protein